MATRSFIALQNSPYHDSPVTLIYCHWDGYPEHVGATLAEHYDTIEKVQELLRLGDLSQLGKTPADCVAYCRDRGESWSDVRPRDMSEQTAIDSMEDSWVEYLYVFSPEDGGWGYYTRQAGTFAEARFNFVTLRAL